MAVYNASVSETANNGGWGAVAWGSDIWGSTPSVTDTLYPSGTSSVVISEGFQATWGANTWGQGVWGGSSSLVDVVTDNISLNGNVAETVTATESEDASSLLINAISETATVTETITTSYLTNAIISETVSHHSCFPVEISQIPGC